MNRAALVRGIQLIVLITLGTFAFLLYRAIHEQRASLTLGLAHVKPGWLLVAAVLALQEGVCGGLRMFVLSRVLTPEIKVRTAIVSEFVLMFVAGVTPGQLGAPIAQVAVLVHGGMKFSAIATSELLTAFCTIVFFLATAVGLIVMRAKGLLVVHGAQLDFLVGLSATVFGTALIALILCAAWPPLLKGAIRFFAAILGPIRQVLLKPFGRVQRFSRITSHELARRGAFSSRLIVSVDHVHEGFKVYLRRGKLALLTALLLTFGFFLSRFAVAYFILLGLGIPTTPNTFVAVGPPVVQVILIQALLNFALYLSPTPGASGIAEAGSNTLMQPWVRGAFEIPYLMLWRILALFLCMFVGGIYVFRYLGTDVLEENVKEAEAQKRAYEEEERSRRAAGS
ncbi:MAG: flippase-like domain-containing protein [Polyangiales bacterium]